MRLITSCKYWEIVSFAASVYLKRNLYYNLFFIQLKKNCEIISVWPNSRYYQEADDQFRGFLTFINPGFSIPEIKWFQPEPEAEKVIESFFGVFSSRKSRHLIVQKIFFYVALQALQPNYIRVKLTSWRCYL